MANIGGKSGNVRYTFDFERQVVKTCRRRRHFFCRKYPKLIVDPYRLIIQKQDGNG